MGGCCSIENAPSLIASIAAGVVGLFLLTKAIDDWQLERVRRKNRQSRHSMTRETPVEPSSSDL